MFFPFNYLLAFAKISRYMLVFMMAFYFTIFIALYFSRFANIHDGVYCWKPYFLPRILLGSVGILASNFWVVAINNVYSFYFSFSGFSCFFRFFLFLPGLPLPFFPLLLSFFSGFLIFYITFPFTNISF